MITWAQVLERTDNGKTELRIYRIEGAAAVHRGAVVPLSDLRERALQFVESENPFDVMGRLYLVCFKGVADKRQNKFEIKSIPVEGARFAYGLALETGELLTLREFMQENAYSVDDIVSILTRIENGKIRNFQRRRKS